MDFNIRQEQIKDYEAVHKVVELASEIWKTATITNLF